MTHKSTMVELPTELMALGYSSPGIEAMVAEALSGEYHDYKNRKYACGKHAVVDALEEEASLPRTPRAVREALRAISARVKNGEFDEHADEEDKEQMRKELPRHMWPAFGLEIQH